MYLNFRILIKAIRLGGKKNSKKIFEEKRLKSLKGLIVFYTGYNIERAFL